MSVAEKTVTAVFAQLKARPTGATFDELAKLTGLSIHTVRQAISQLNHKGNIAQSMSRPVVLRAIESPPKAGEVLIIREPMPPLEIDPKLINVIQSAIAGPAKEESDEMLVVLFHKARTLNPDKLHNLMKFLVNYTEVIRQQLANNKELSIDDLNGK